MPAVRKKRRLAGTAPREEGAAPTYIPSASALGQLLSRLRRWARAPERVPIRCRGVRVTSHIEANGDKELSRAFGHGMPCPY